MDKTLIFHHLPKASGTSLRAILHREYDRTRIFTFDGRDAEKSVRKYRQLTDEEKAHYDLIDGHYPVGLHEIIPKPSVYITLVRNPVDRFISYYYHVLRDPEHYVYKQGFTADMSIRDFVRKGIAHTETHNGQVWFLSGGASPDIDPKGALAKAIKNLDELFVVAGITEKFDESIILMKRKLGWKKTPIYYRRHVATNRKPIEEIPPDVLDEIIEVNQLDIALYKYVTQRLDDAIADQGNSFRRELLFFKLINRTCQQLMNIRFALSKLKHQILDSD